MHPYLCGVTGHQSAVAPCPQRQQWGTYVQMKEKDISVSDKTTKQLHINKANVFLLISKLSNDLP